MSEVLGKVFTTATYETIAGQAQELRRLYNDNQTLEGTERAARLLLRARRVYLVGTGTSFHAAQMGQFLLRSVGADAWAIPAFDFALYPQPLSPEDVVILFSHRGTKLFSKQSLEKAQATGLRAIVVTGQGSPLVAEAGETLVLQTTAPERSSTHTASYITALAIVIQLASFLAEKRGNAARATQLRAGLKEAAVGIEAAIEQQGKIAEFARQMSGEKARIFIAGPGASGITAAEGALKLKEAAYVTAEGTSLETFLHGPIVGLGLGDCLILINTFAKGPAAERTADITRAALQIGVKLYFIGTLPAKLEASALSPQSSVLLDVPAEDEFCAALVQTVPLQLLACYLAEARGTNPDSFRLEFADYKAAIGAIKL